ncbi:hypothetical protein CH380_07720 [Leptospira adleri]|uniref:Uncharacterized protein n=1 Tax=Leptospira adleri TaxID=2023186 RepID=A0A2M9YQT5_9LEPT|nr:hypothetical protein CH380_07720 [Leptospira adleri]PJZ63101.1 hypothetical protein CH376_04410 [Leptospira adleri]
MRKRRFEFREELRRSRKISRTNSTQTIVGVRFCADLENLSSIEIFFRMSFYESLSVKICL